MLWLELQRLWTITRCVQKCSDLIFGNVLGILCARGLDVSACEGRTDPDSQAVIIFSGTSRYSVTQIDSMVCLLCLFSV